MEQSIINYLKYCISNYKSSAILILAASQNRETLMSAISRFVAEQHRWVEGIDITSPGAFREAINSLYLKHSILIELKQKPYQNEEYYLMLETTSYNMLFIDQVMSADDPVLTTAMN